MDYKCFTLETDAQGIALVTWDMAGKSMNVIDEAVLDDLNRLIEQITGDEAIKGVIITSGKTSFCAGADLAMMEAANKRYEKTLAASGDTAATRELLDDFSRLGKLLRQLETCGKPVAAAINGTALGGGFEICLACHYRVASDTASTKLGLPESRVGLLPGAGGTQRLPRLIGAQEALQLMLEGRHIDVAKALKLGAIHKVVPEGELIAEARRWFAEEATSEQPWDNKRFKIPGGAVYSPQGMMLWSAANALYRKKTYDNYNAQRAIMKCVYEGLTVKSIDAGMLIEARYFTSLLKDPQSRNMIRSLFLSMQALGKGARRPADIEDQSVRKLGIIGAGFMGAGIAYVSARAGLQVVLIDRDQDNADKGKAHSAQLMDKAISRGKASEADKEALLGLITASNDYDALKGCDLVIEAVFENRDLKSTVLPEAESRLKRGAIMSSNTSTLPITGLSKYVKRPKDFIGVHFFSPVDKMMLVEIIVGKKTGDAAIAKALDYVRQIRKTPIVVNDSRGFFTSRVVTTYLGEGHHMLDEGVPPALIENAGRMAGMPVGPLSLNDEVALDLSWKIIQATRDDLGDKYEPGPMDRILEEMVVRQGRNGRKNAKGFYDYPEDGKKRLWPGIGDIAPAADGATFDVETIKERLLLIQALETARCFEENVLTDVREADVGAILGFGFAPYTGGPLSYIDTMGAAEFVARCKRYHKLHSKRYKPCRLLVEMAKSGETFYGRFPPAQREAA
jgi:3-hydroxyacyl-CoA dehydrogenase/enoyl-CoA hydratase/3-hydroxybutyryl-CoA epimerase